ncbi:hypothetical protein [Brevibacterium sp. S111]|uniref:hypothetical protein n=1 Tax=unclassified Brevibacterium TaxID=2614124 RepID=UPI0010815FB3|nr:hypothetical protein [Brevibacterium sp. S111]TGD11410.1 hypothetical protein EB836_09150 [Brevibacterium sp. S111]
MRWIPRLLAGTCVVVAGALTAVPVTAGLADLVLNPGPQSTKRSAQPALTSQRTNTPPTNRPEESAAADGGSHQIVEGTIVDTAAAGTDAAGIVSTASTLVAATPDAAHARVSELAADLQAGVAAGEFAQADADRVLADIAGYIHGERTWPERLPA